MKSPNVVIKVGSGIIFSERGKLKRHKLHEIADDVATIADQGVLWPTIVASGATACGLGLVRSAQLHGPVISAEDIKLKQALASIGQPELFVAFQRRLRRIYGVLAGQILLTQHDFDFAAETNNFLHTHSTLQSLGAVAIINENDPIATEEFLTDNDIIAGQVTKALDASDLVIMSPIGGFYANGRLVQNIAPDEHAHYRQFVGEVASQSELPRGGMASKFEVGCEAALNGTRVTIIGERSLDRVLHAVNGQQIGTVFEPAA